MVNEEIVGNDINKDWILGPEGDLDIIYGSNNLSQAIYLRLSAYFDSLSWAYDFYGSYTKDWLGKNQNPYTRSTLRQEIAKRVSRDPRIYDAEVMIENWSISSIGIYIIAHIEEGKTFREYFIFSDLPRNNENINDPQWKNTWIDTSRPEYYAKAGEYLTVHCYVRDSVENKKVPIGEVQLSLGGFNIDNGNNPQMVGQSDSDDPGGCKFTFRLPAYIKEGVHKLKFKYKGIRGYNGCVETIDLHVLKRIPTSMRFIYPTPTRYYVANDYDNFTDSVVHVRDMNMYNVEKGEVRYYLSDYDDDEEFVFIEFPIIFNRSTLLKHTVYLYCSSKLLDYSLKFVFQLNYMFRPLEIIELRGPEGEHIDFLEVGYEDEIFFLTSTKYTKPYEYVHNGKRVNIPRNDTIDEIRGANSSIWLDVIE